MKTGGRKKLLIWSLTGFLVLVLIWVWFRHLSPTRIAVVAFPGFTIDKMEKANKNRWVRLHELELDELDKIKRYALLLVRGHGVRISSEQLEQLKKGIKNGVKVHITDATNIKYDLSNLKGEELDYVSTLLDNKCSANFQNLFNYTRRRIDGKILFNRPWGDPEILPEDFLFHLDTERFFSTVEEFESYYRKGGFQKEGRPRVALLEGNINIQNSNAKHTFELIRALEEKNLNVYPIRSFGKERLALLEKCNPDLVILRPHGRLAMWQQEKAVNWLREQNIPLLAPLTVYGEYDKWLTDPQGMYGGMLSMSVVMPELDGATAPYAIVAQNKSREGNLVFQGIESRIGDFSELVDKWLRLKGLSNEKKRVAIYYFKGPGKNSLVAAGLEVVPSLYRVLKELESQGYKVEGLPSTKEEFEKILMEKGPVLGPYAPGAFSEYLETGDPVLVDKTQYEDWCQQAMPSDLYEQVVEKYGPPPGSYMRVYKDGKEHLAVTAVRFGNVCLLPQPLPGLGENTQQLVHGAKTAPPHTYIASYLWARYGFRADAIMHFGTHGSLEFTPGKQVALSDYDWADRLIGPVPHFYNYTISNIGEGIIAKRRSYATLLTYLTPPFMKSGLRDELEEIHDKLDRYNSLPDGPVREQYAISTKELAEQMELHLTLGLDSARPYGQQEMHTIHEYLEEIEQAKVGAGLYTMGIPYSLEKQRNTALLVSVDPLAFALADLDLQKGRITAEQFQDEMFVSKNYRPKASSLVRQVLDGRDAETVIARVLSGEERAMAHQWEKENSEVDLLELMMSYGENKGRNGVETRNADDLHVLVARLCGEEKNREYIESLESEQLFEKASGLLEEGSRNKAIKMAEKMKKMAPEMYQMISVGTQPEMLELLQLMQDSITRLQIFELLKDEDLASRIEQQHVALLKEKARQCDDPPVAEWIGKALATFITELLPEDSHELNEGIHALRFVLENRECFEYCAHPVYSRFEINPDYWNITLENSLKQLEQRLAEVREKEGNYALAVLKIEHGLTDAYRVMEDLSKSPRTELASVLNALSGGFTAPSSGGDPIVNPAALPTGRNMYAVDAERTPSDEAWKVGKRLAESLLEEEFVLKGHYPKKVSFTLWSTNFISTEGATIAQILYLLGVEPVRDGFGSVRNLKLIPIEQLGRPRIDVVIQTSGQLRDLAASRLDLVNRAIAMAAEAKDADSLNYVKHGLLVSEKYLLDQGFSPLDARTYASKRIFGGVNGNYGTGIMTLVEKGDAWEDEEEIASQYLNNMGAIYEKGENWGMFREGIFQAALQETEAVVQPRSSNTWGPLSLDHVYEFMGGMNLTVRHVTGNDPTAYFNDFRNTSRPKMQELKKAIGVETNSTVFNPKYISELLDGEASSMEKFAETFRNTYGWNVMKPSAIDKHVWDNYFDIYMEDKYDLGVRERFEDENPYALQEMTSVMLETARKGYWEASEAQLAALAELHAVLVSKHEAGCSGFVCDNALLRKFIAQRLPAVKAENYQRAIEAERSASIQENQEQVVLEKVENQKMQNQKASSESQRRLSLWLIVTVIVLFILFFVIRRRH